MATIQSAIIAMNPSCTPKFLNTKTPLALEHIKEFYDLREQWIDYYIRILKETYAKYGYDTPFADYGEESSKLINADFGSDAMQRKMRIVHAYENKWSKGVNEAITEYIYRREKRYFCEKCDKYGKFYFDENYAVDISLKNYFYLLALDEAIYELYKYNKKLIAKNPTFKHEDLIIYYVTNTLGIKEGRSYEDEPTYIREEDLPLLGYDELPADYLIDNLLGPKGPGR